MKMTNPVIDSYGNKYWYNSDGQIHRKDGPAIEYTSGTKEWYINGLRHRENGPAVEWYNGSKEWYINGKCHRDDGPAYEGKDGSKEWYIKDIRITDQVEQWIKDNNLPEYEDWTDSIKVLFKLTFG